VCSSDLVSEQKHKASKSFREILRTNSVEVVDQRV
jgi:hypothetical protein